MRVHGCVVLVLAAACSGPSPRPAPPPTPTSTAEPAPAAPLNPAPTSLPASRPVAPAPTPSSSSQAGSAHPLPKPLALLGTPCEVSPKRGTHIFCNADGIVAAVAVAVDMVRGVPPENAESVDAWEDTSESHQKELVMAREGERLWVRHVTCGNCRRVMGHAFVADLDRLDDRALKALQAHVGVSESPLLKTVDAWRDAYRALRPSEK